jgi:hypothetical protein
MTPEVRLDKRNAAGCSASGQSIGCFGRPLRTPSAFALAGEAHESYHGRNTLGNPGNLGLISGRVYGY